jgi:hypothetical protein
MLIQLLENVLQSALIPILLKIPQKLANLHAHNKILSIPLQITLLEYVLLLAHYILLPLVIFQIFNVSVSVLVYIMDNTLPIYAYLFALQ